MSTLHPLQQIPDREQSQKLTHAALWSAHDKLQLTTRLLRDVGQHKGVRIIGALATLLIKCTIAQDPDDSHFLGPREPMFVYLATALFGP